LAFCCRIEVHAGHLDAKWALRKLVSCHGMSPDYSGKVGKMTRFLWRAVVGGLFLKVSICSRKPDELDVEAVQLIQQFEEGLH
jgi:hypothetical protein